MAALYIERRSITAHIPTALEIPYEPATATVPIPSKEERLRISNIFADNMEMLFSPRPSAPSLSGDVKSDCLEDFVEKLTLVSAAEPHRIQVRPKECDLQKLNAEIVVDISLLRSISLASQLPIDAEICQNLSHTVAVANHHIMNHPQSAVVEAKNELPSKTTHLDLYHLKVCQNLADTLGVNLRIIRENLARADNPSAKMHFRPGFAELSYAIASDPIDTIRKLPEGAYGVTSLVTHSNGVRYVTKRAFSEEELKSKCSARIPFHQRDNFLRTHIAKSVLSLSRETSVDYSLPTSCEGIVKFFGVNKEGHLLFEYIPGRELLDAIRENKFSTEQIYDLAKALANTMAYLHQQKLIHADLKLENILLDGLNPKVIDFGAARTEFTTADLQETIGTVKYLAPEILRLGQPRDNKIDVWSYGCILYTLLTGRFFVDDLLKKDATEKLLQEFFEKHKETLDRKIIDLLNKLDLRKKSPSLTRLYLALSSSLKINPKERATMKEISDLF